MAKQWHQLQDQLFILSHLNMVKEQLIKQIFEHGINKQLTLKVQSNYDVNGGVDGDKNVHVDELHIMNKLNDCIKIVPYDVNMKVNYCLFFNNLLLLLLLNQISHKTK